MSKLGLRYLEISEVYQRTPISLGRTSRGTLLNTSFVFFLCYKASRAPEHEGTFSRDLTTQNVGKGRQGPWFHCRDSEQREKAAMPVMGALRLIRAGGEYCTRHLLLKETKGHQEASSF